MVSPRALLHYLADLHLWHQVGVVGHVGRELTGMGEEAVQEILHRLEVQMHNGNEWGIGIGRFVYLGVRIASNESVTERGIIASKLRLLK